MVREHWANCSAHDAACLPFGVVSELRRKLGPIMTLVLLLGMGVDVWTFDIRVRQSFQARASVLLHSADSRLGIIPSLRNTGS